MATTALDPTRINPLNIVNFHMTKIRGLVAELRKFVPETVYEMDIAWHPASKQIAQNVVTTCRAEGFSATYEPPNQGRTKYQIKINLKKLVRSLH
jgi:hypothetical protein